MQSLYKQIKILTLSDNLSEFFEELHLQEGYELMKKVTTVTVEQIVLAKYCNEIYNPESKLIEVHKKIDDIKKKVLKDLGYDLEGLYKDIAENKNEDYNNYIAWYYKQIKDGEFEAIRTGEELIAEQLQVARTRIEKKVVKKKKGDDDDNEEISMDDDRYLRAMNLKNTCYTNAVDNIDKIGLLKKKLMERFENIDKLRADEIAFNTGAAESEAMFLKNRKKNGNS